MTEFYSGYQAGIVTILLIELIVLLVIGRMSK